MEPELTGMTVALVVVSLIALASLAVLVYVVIRLVQFGTRTPWFLIEKDDRGVVQVAAMAAPQEHQPPTMPAARREPEKLEIPPDDPGFPGWDGEGEPELVGEREAG